MPSITEIAQQRAQQTQPGQVPPGTLGAPPAQQPPQIQQQTPAQGLPPTGIDQQLATLNQTYQAVQNVPKTGFNVLQQQMQGGQADPLQGPGGQQGPAGSTNIQQLARSLAQSYGLAIGRGNLVDAQGNFLMTPDQLASASGDTLGESAAKMNYISRAIARQQNEQQQKKAIASIQTGLGQVQQRGRGSLASMQSGMYQDLADLYSNQEYEAADFSYFIQKEQMDIAQNLMRRQEKLAKKGARGSFLGGIGMTIAGFATGNVAMGMAGFGTAAGAAGGTGWF